jgi:hypothetical protein
LVRALKRHEPGMSISFLFYYSSVWELGARVTSPPALALLSNPGIFCTDSILKSILPGQRFAMKVWAATFNTTTRW